MELLLIIVLLGLITWNLKTGFQRIEKQLRDIANALKEKK